MADLVFNIRPASASRISAMDRHENDRTKDGSSAIEPGRSHLNKTLYGNSNGPLAALEDLYASGVRKASKQAESPYLQIVAGASPSYFRPCDPEARGTWDETRLRAWQNRTLAWLRAEFGNDLVHASIHLDEDTPTTEPITRHEDTAKIAALEVEVREVRNQLADMRSDRDDWRDQAKQLSERLHSEIKPRGLFAWLFGR